MPKHFFSVSLLHVSGPLFSTCPVVSSTRIRSYLPSLTDSEKSLSVFGRVSVVHLSQRVSHQVPGGLLSVDSTDKCTSKTPSPGSNDPVPENLIRGLYYVELFEGSIVKTSDFGL